MDNVSECPFCRLSAAHPGPAEPWDTILAETEDCLILPSKGSLVPGWLLVVPKAHYLRSLELDVGQWTSLQASVDAAVQLIDRRFGAPTIFEHGPKRNGTPFGCGVDHVHLHVVPVSFSLSNALETEGHVSKWIDERQARELKDHLGEYLLVKEPGADVRLALLNNPRRQLARRVIASRVGCEDEYDYVRFPHKRNVERTLQLIRSSAA